MKNKSTKTSAWGERLTNLSEKGLEHFFTWAFIGFSLHRDASQRKEAWFTDNTAGVTGGPFESESGRQGDANRL